MPGARLARWKLSVMQPCSFTHLSRDIHPETCCHFFEIQNHHEHSRTTPLADRPFWNFISESGQFRVGPNWKEKKFRGPHLIQVKSLSKPIFGFPIPACIPYSPCNDRDAVNWRCGNCTRNKCRSRHFDGWNRHHTSRHHRCGRWQGCLWCQGCSQWGTGHRGHPIGHLGHRGQDAGCRWRWPANGRNRLRQERRRHMPRQGIRRWNPEPIGTKGWQWTHGPIWQTWPWRETYNS